MPPLALLARACPSRTQSRANGSGNTPRKLRAELMADLQAGLPGFQRRPTRIARPEPGIRRGPRESWNPRESNRSSRPGIRSGLSLNPRGLRSGETPLASNRTALTGDPPPEKANRTGLPFIGSGLAPNGTGFPPNGTGLPCNGTGFPFHGTGVRLNRTAEPSVRGAEGMSGCAERSDRTAVPSNI